MKRAAIFFIVLAGCGQQTVDPCAKVAGACLAIQIDESADVTSIDGATLHLTATGLDNTQTTMSPKPISLPLAVGASLSDAVVGDSIALSVDVVGLLAGAQIGSGSAMATIARGQHVTVHVSLRHAPPDDMAVEDMAVDDLGDLSGADLTDIAGVTYPLTLTVTGNGSVTASPAINCPGTCTDSYAGGTVVTLTATAGMDSLFGGWGGACSGFATTCMVTMSQAQTVVASFGLKTTVNVTYSTTNPAVGTITSTPPGISCPGTCTAQFAMGSTVTLTGTPTIKTGSWFSGWTGDCSASGAQPVCNLLVDATKNATGAFVPVNYMFVTSITKTLPLDTPNSNAGTEFAATTLCKFLAEQAGLPMNMHWRAWLSYSNAVQTPPDAASTPVNAISEIGRNFAAPTMITTPRGWIRPDNRPFTDSLTALTMQTGSSNNVIYYLPNVDETGAAVPFDTWVGTGSSSQGQYLGAETCTVSGADYDTSTNAIIGGRADTASGAWTNAFQGANKPNCNNAMRFYCFQNDYQTTIVPPKTKGRYAFVSQAKWDPSLGIANADMLCQSEATANNLLQGDPAAVFKAVLGTTTASASSRFTTVGRMNWVRPDGVQITAHPGDLFDLSTKLLAALNVESNATSYLADTEYAWTGADAGFTAVATSTTKTCNNWGVGGTTGAAGIVSYAATEMQYSSAIPSSCVPNQSHLYCLQDSDPP